MKRKISVLLILVLLLSISLSSITKAGIQFDDVRVHWARDYILQLANLGLVRGKTANEFAPDANITRAEFLTMALNISGISVGGGVVYSDIASNAWFHDVVATSKRLGLINPNMTLDGRFYPDKSMNCLFKNLCRLEMLRFSVITDDFQCGQRHILERQ